MKFKLKGLSKSSYKTNMRFDVSQNDTDFYKVVDVIDSFVRFILFQYLKGN
jgi:hypothetical protein